MNSIWSSSGRSESQELARMLNWSTKTKTFEFRKSVTYLSILAARALRLSWAIMFDWTRLKAAGLTLAGMLVVKVFGTESDKGKLSNEL